MITIYYMHIQEAEKISESAFQKAFPQRFERAQRFHFPEDRARSICVGVLLHDRLGLTEKDIRYREYGKPYSEKSPFFSISHSGNYAVLALSSAEVGVDIERTDRNALELMRQVFTEDEIAYVGDSHERFYRIWTLKEGICKAVGLGLHMPLKRVPVLPLLQGETVLQQGAIWHGTTCCLEESKYILSCVSQSAETPELVRHHVL